MNSPVTWFEITSPDAGSLRTFYADTFGWSPKPSVREGRELREVRWVTVAPRCGRGRR